MRTVIVSIWVWVATVFLMVAWIPLMAVVRLFDRDPGLYNSGLMLRYLGRAITYVNPFWDIHVDGHFPDDPRNPYVCVGNHQSQGDPPIVARVPWEMKWVAKIELFNLPITGQLLKLSGDIPVDRRDRDSRANVLVKCREYLDAKCSVMLFPEGTRSRDGRVQRFADGAFRLAIKAGVPVIPIALDGSKDALPKHSMWFDPNPEPIKVRVLEPVPTDGYTVDQANDLQREVRARIIAQLAEWRGVAPEDVDALEGRSDDDASDEQAESDADDAPDEETSVDGEASVNPAASS